MSESFEEEITLIHKDINEDFESLTGAKPIGIANVLNALIATNIAEINDKIEFIKKNSFIHSADKEYLYLLSNGIIKPKFAKFAEGSVLILGEEGVEIKEGTKIFNKETGLYYTIQGSDSLKSLIITNPLSFYSIRTHTFSYKDKDGTFLIKFYGRDEIFRDVYLHRNLFFNKENINYIYTIKNGQKIYKNSNNIIIKGFNRDNFINSIKDDMFDRDGELNDDIQYISIKNFTNHKDFMFCEIIENTEGNRNISQLYMDMYKYEIKADEEGSSYNIPIGTEMNTVTQIQGLRAIYSYDIINGADEEDIEIYRKKVLERIGKANAPFSEQNIKNTINDTYPFIEHIYLHTDHSQLEVWLYSKNNINDKVKKNIKKAIQNIIPFHRSNSYNVDIFEIRTKEFNITINKLETKKKGESVDELKRKIKANLTYYFETNYIYAKKITINSIKNIINNSYVYNPSYGLIEVKNVEIKTHENQEPIFENKVPYNTNLKVLWVLKEIIFKEGE